MMLPTYSLENHHKVNLFISKEVKTLDKYAFIQNSSHTLNI